MFTDKVRVHWDNASSQGGWCMPSSKTKYPVEATLKIDGDQVWWTNSIGTVTTIARGLIFGATRVFRPLPALKTRKSATVLNQKTHTEGGIYSVENSPYWLLHAVELSNGRLDKASGIRRILFESQSSGAKECVAAVEDCARVRQTVKNILVIVNPFGGTKKARRTYEKVVKPMLQLAGINVQLQETTHIGHATEIAHALRLDLYSAIVTVSGDGVFHEVVNGLLKRPDWEQARKMPIGVVAGGSANAMNKNLMTLQPELATLAVIKGHTRPMDVFSISQNDTVMYSHLQFMWTLLADLDFESENYRWMGGERMTVAAIIRLLRLRTYRGKMYLLPADQAHAHDQSANAQPGDGQHGPLRRFTASPTAHQSWPKITDTTFNLFVATNLAWISDEFMASPSARLANGEIDVIWSEEMSVIQGLAAVTDQGSGKYLQLPYIKQERVKALVLEPHGWAWDKDGRKNVHAGTYLNVSGERVPYLPTRMELHPGVLTVIAPEWLDEEEWTRIADKARRKG
ncbi:hypothetical protein PhCBS80983_g01406 [Powellomyces hirtus]|uniref:DAGKc domain-containing protein n=1 Tax=Powellomyces hirtus TaxID=109895 RepID=A0A507ED20_9FUNG|nr:hypothetical protein PhCBS80983_g01406 [Powellomyces hirtus]